MGIRLKGMTNNRETEIIHIKGMDITTTTKDIITAIEKTTGALEENSYKIGNCRPNANNTLAVTVTLPKEMSKKLITEKTIRVGMVRCNVQKRIQMDKCRICWSYNHKEKDCNGPDRRRLCFRCGNEDHKSNECKQEKEACPLCKTTGHRAGTAMCATFRRALSTCRKWERQKSTTTS